VIKLEEKKEKITLVNSFKIIKEEIEDLKERSCSSNKCTLNIDFITFLRRFEQKHYYYKAINGYNSEIEVREVIKKVVSFWNNDKVSILCCICNRIFEKTLKNHQKITRLVNKVKRICDKYKFKFEVN
jgi:hypothetical protein